MPSARGGGFALSADLDGEGHYYDMRNRIYHLAKWLTRHLLPNFTWLNTYGLASKSHMGPWVPGRMSPWYHVRVGVWAHEPFGPRSHGRSWAYGALGPEVHGPVNPLGPWARGLLGP